MSSQSATFSIGTALLVGALVSSYLSIPPPPETLELAQDTVDMGSLEQGQTVMAEFELTNRYRLNLEITNVMESCSCSTSTLQKKAPTTGRENKTSADLEDRNTSRPDQGTCLCHFSARRPKKWLSNAYDPWRRPSGHHL